MEFKAVESWLEVFACNTCGVCDHRPTLYTGACARMGKRARTSEGSGTTFEEEFRRLGAAGAVHTREEADRIVCMMQSVREEMDGAVARLITGAGAQAVLISYSSDAMSARVANTHTSSSAEGTVVRKGYGLQKVLLQRRFF
eukprot:6489274-Amphidinium_carterae.1